MDQYPDISPEVLERIERYLTLRMEPGETAAFESELDTDPVLRAQTAEIRLLITGIREVSVAEQMKGFHAGLQAGKQEEQAPPRIGGLKRWLVAASVIAVVGIGTWFALGRGPQQNGIYASYYEKDPGLLSAMGSTSDNYDFDRAMIDYKKGDHAAAIKTWELLVKSSPANDTLNYFLGSAWLAQGDAPKALSYFNKVISTGKSVFLDDTYWYAGLALIREDRKAEAVPLIEKSKREEKGELLQKLR
ncbi:MAG: hypothetical protein EOO09_02180 [Chitinophagaceae bacterium]|nr:MAG: hypothetical protein EOO09_02180 [Chitinophagaceae bacterium]